jgi:SAM-dependent methyltransferase
MDIAEGLLHKQRKIAEDRGVKGIEYIKQDLNDVVLDGNAYDVIFAVGTIHHVEKLELFFDQINNALKDNGKVIMREYVGPNRVQFTDLQLNITNEILSILPERYKTRRDGSIKNRALNCDIDYLMKRDPSESVRSQDIVRVMKERLEIIKLAYTGGTILHPLLNEIASNFEQDEDAETILQLLIFLEKMLIEKGILPSDYVFCIAQKKLPSADNPGARLYPLQKNNPVLSELQI